LNGQIGRLNSSSGFAKGVGDTAGFGLHRLSPFADNGVTSGEGVGYGTGAVTGIAFPAAAARGIGLFGSKLLGIKSMEQFGKTGRPGLVNYKAQQDLLKVQDDVQAVRNSTGRTQGKFRDAILQGNKSFLKDLRHARNIAPELAPTENALQKAEQLKKVAPYADTGFDALRAGTLYLHDTNQNDSQPQNHQQ
jgi:hypothetical protein